MKSLVVGGCGFIGRAIVEELLKKGHEIIIFDNNITNKIDNPLVKYIFADFTDLSDIKKYTIGVDHIYALGGLLGTFELYDIPQKAVRTNVEGHINILEASRVNNVSRIFYPTMPYIWKNIYSVSKFCGEELYKAYRLGYNLDIRILRLWNVYGPYQKWEPVKKVVPEFILKALSGDPLEIYGNQDYLLNLAYVKDTAQSIVEFMNLPGYFNGTYDMKRISLECSKIQLAKTIIEICDSTSKIIFLPPRKGEFINKDRLTKKIHDIDKFIPLVQQTKLIEGLTKTINHYRGIYKNI